jgi:hypothetical protein
MNISPTCPVPEARFEQTESTMDDSDDFRSRFEARNQTTSAVETITGASEVDRAIAKLVLAFGTDPVARWMYDDPHEYLLNIPRLFRDLGTSLEIMETIQVGSSPSIFPMLRQPRRGTTESEAQAPLGRLRL